MSTETPRHQPACAAWANRILILSLIGIAYLTLFPFQFHPGAFRAIHGNPFFLGDSGKEYFTRDFFLNVLLFVPFGFGVSAQVGKRGGSLVKAFLWSLTLGAFVSYAVEFLQLYIPLRDSGWEDVFSNTTGSVVGFMLFGLLGGPLLAGLSEWEDWLTARFSPRLTAALLGVYFAAGFGVSAYLQNQTRLSNWDANCPLFLGNDASGKAPWAGRVSLLQIWNRALPEATVRRLAAHERIADQGASLLASYDLRGPAPFADQNHVLPPLSWTPKQTPAPDSDAGRLSPKAWLGTTIPAENLTQEIRRTNKFTIRVICLPDAIERGTGRIVSLSRSADNVNFHLRQRGADLVFYFRDPLTEARSVLAWPIPAVFQADKTKDIVAVYDGSDAFVYVDGIPAPQDYRLGPGASLFHSFGFVQTTELQGYVILYYTLLFLPAGVLAGLGLRNCRTHGAASLWLLGLGWALPAVLCEGLLIFQTGRRFWPDNVALALVFELAGMLLINSDRTAEALAEVQPAGLESSGRGGPD
jgi:VanZ like protein